MHSEEQPVAASQSWWQLKNNLYEFLSSTRIMILMTVLPVGVLLFFVLALPIGWAIAAGFFDIYIFDPVWEYSGLENYHEFLTNPDFWDSLGKSVIFAVGSVTIQLIAGIAIAIQLNKKIRFISIFRALLFLPYLIPTVVVAWLALWMGNTQWGILNTMLVEWTSIQQPIPWFGSSKWALPAIVIVNSWKFTIFVTIMVLARLQGIPDGYYEAAQMAGANAWQQFRDITLPNLKNVIFIVLLLRGIWMFNKFDIIWVLTGGGPRGATTTAPVYAYKTAFSSQALGKSAAISTFLFLLLTVVAVIYFYAFDPEQEVRVE
jgi:multiple sugar transport system permease protein